MSEAPGPRFLPRPGIRPGFRPDPATVLLCAGMALLLGFRAYGHYVDDQADFLLHARELAGKGRLAQALPDAGEIPGNFHPPLMLLLLGLLVKVSGILLAPALLQTACTFGTLFLLLGLRGRGPEAEPAGNRIFASALFFFLLPFTHQGFLFLDIDNSLLPLWGALFIRVLTGEREAGGAGAEGSPDRPLRFAVRLGLVFAFGFACKLTTPLAVLAVWAPLNLLRRPDRRGLLETLAVPLVAAAVFLPAYAAACLAMDLPFAYPFQLTFSKFFSVSQAAGPAARLGTALRSVFWDIHWFSALTLAVVLAKTVADLKSFPWKAGIRENLPRLHPLLFFWALYLGYTLVIPTLWLPRYKFGLLPFLFWWLKDDFIRLAAVRPGRSLGIARSAGIARLGALIALGAILSLALPDLATSATLHEFRFHSLSPLAPALAGLPYYPEAIAEWIGRLEATTRGSLLQAPVSAFRFALHFLTWVGLASILAAAAAAVALRRMPGRVPGGVLGGLLALATVSWACRFAQDMRRDYALFYCAGSTGFAEMADTLSARLGPGEVFLGRKDFGLYTGRPFIQLYRYGPSGMEADTSRLASLLADRPIRYLVYKQGDPYRDPGFLDFVGRRFDPDSRVGDYVLWRSRLISGTP